MIFPLHAKLIKSRFHHIKHHICKFDDFLISFVGILEGSQWSGQVKESLELQLTYGKVISASLFMIVVAGGRFVIPWQRITGVIETGLSKIRN